MVDPITQGLKLVDTFINKFVSDKDLAQNLSAQARSEQFQGELKLLVGQMEINKVEAASSSIFVAGWRPFVGWVCGIALAYNFILYPIMKFIVVLTVVDIPELPVLNSTELMTVLMGMLGLGTLRTYEKSQDVSRSKI
jgi:hypothetical protein